MISRPNSPKRYRSSNASSPRSRESLGFSKDDGVPFRPFVEQFVADVDALIRRHGLSPGDVPPKAVRDRINAEVHELQTAAEWGMAAWLTEAQRRHLPGRTPVLFRISFENAVTYETVSSPGF